MINLILFENLNGLQIEFLFTGDKKSNWFQHDTQLCVKKGFFKLPSE